MKRVVVMLAVLLPVLGMASSGCLPTAPELQTQYVTSTVSAPQGEPTILGATAHRDASGSVVVMGEVLNEVECTITLTEVKGTFYDADRAEIGTSFGSAELDLLRQGQKTPFKVGFSPGEVSPKSYRVDVSWQQAEEEPFDGLTIVGHSGEVDSQGCYQITGEVRNEGTETAHSVNVVCTCYDSEGKVREALSGYTDPQDIEPGDTAPFELSSYPTQLEPAHYELQVEARSLGD